MCREIYRFQETLQEKTIRLICLLVLDKDEIPEEIDVCSVHIVHVSPIVMKKLSGLQSTESIEAIALMRIPTTYLNLSSDKEEAYSDRWFPCPHRILVLDGIQVILSPI